MDDTTQGVISVTLYSAILALGVWSNRNTPGFWSAEAIRARGRLAHRIIAFGGSIGGMIVCAMSFSRAPIWFSGWATGFAIAAWLCRPQWMHAKRHVNPPALSRDNPPGRN